MARCDRCGYIGAELHICDTISCLHGKLDCDICFSEKEKEKIHRKLRFQELIEKIFKTKADITKVDDKETISQ